MSLLSTLLRLRPPRRYTVRVERATQIPMADGVRLLADRYYPAGHENAPVVLIRSPYGRGSANDLVATFIAERGYHVIYQSLRGTGGSGGDFEGFTMHPADGPATISWLRAQPWFRGAFATWGASYLGYAQWELATHDIPEWKAAIIQDAPSEFYRTFMYPGGPFALGNALAWVYLVQTMFDSDGSLVRQLTAQLTGFRKLHRAAGLLPVSDADRTATGRHVEHFQQWITHEHQDAYWARMNHRDNTEHMPPVVHLAGGWHDFFLPGTVHDYAALRATGRSVRLLIGPWGHGKGSMTKVYLRDALATLDAAFTGTGVVADPPVSLYVTGAQRWTSHADWPPAHAPTPWYLHPAGTLSTEQAPPSPPSGYRYDPADPTPNLGGAIVAFASGPKDNRRLEARPDVLTFTTDPLPDDLDVTGPVTVTLHVRSTNQHTDFYARLCNVHPRGRSINLCDGITRLHPDNPAADQDNVRTVHISLWPVAHRFQRGHRIRLQVSSGAHPRYNRNPGTGEPLATSTTLRAADQEVLHDPGHPSALVLPVATHR